jgi:hypothetical protein
LCITKHPFPASRPAARPRRRLRPKSASTRLLGKRYKLKNLQFESSALPLPVAKDPGRFREKYKHGLVLELWVDEWSFSPLPADTKTYQMTLSARSRLARVEDGRVLWSSGRCSLGNNGTGANHRDLRVPGTDLTADTRLRKLLAGARDECARQLIRDFSAVEERK